MVEVLFHDSAKGPHETVVKYMGVILTQVIKKHSMVTADAGM